MTARRPPRGRGVLLHVCVDGSPTGLSRGPFGEYVWLRRGRLVFESLMSWEKERVLPAADVEELYYEASREGWTTGAVVRLEVRGRRCPIQLHLDERQIHLFTQWAQEWVPDALQRDGARKVAAKRAELAERERVRKMGPRPPVLFGVARKIFGPRLIIPHTVRVELTPRELRVTGLVGLTRAYPLERLRMASRQEYVRRGCIDVTFDVSGQRLPFVIGIPAAMLDDVLAWIAERGSAIRAELVDAATAA